MYYKAPDDESRVVREREKGADATTKYITQVLTPGGRTGPRLVDVMI
jgi:hypothetical protein